MNGSSLPQVWVPDVQRFERILSAPRLKPFLDYSNGKFDQALRLYVWNIAISSSLWGSFHLLEISLRNVLHSELSSYFGTEDWWNSELNFHADTRQQMDRSINAANKKHGVNFSPSHVVAEFSFAFWIDLLSNRYHERLWKHILSKGFSPQEARRRDIHKALEQLRKLRNRIAHHEPIFERPLQDDLKLLNWILGMIDVDIRDWALSKSRTAQLLDERIGRIEGRIQQSF